SPANTKFVKAFKEYAKKTNLPGGDKRVTDDPMEAAYFGVHIWKQGAEKAKSVEVDAVRKAVYGQTFAAPAGTIKMRWHHHNTRVQPAHGPAGPHRPDPEGRPVQDHLAHQGQRGAGAVVEVHEP